MPVPQNLPVFFDFVYTNKNGSLTANAKLYNDLQFQYLNQNFSFGLQIPNRDTADITADINNVNIPLGTIWFNTDMSKLQFKSAPSAVETITSA